MRKNIEEATGTKEFDALLDTIYVIGGKWKMPIIFSICTGGHQRFRDIERGVTGITSRMLSRELKEMEMNKLITRTVYPETPVRIEYEVTEYCKTLVPLIQSMIDWGMLHRQKIKED
ncbi:MAG: transcriptional regulator, HxlR family [Pedobacter sp.]|jgi:DNA-binding HxlR family transcriptional regulator|nr:transcriptional regulator, HxlR family [Pedobacter sp.]